MEPIWAASALVGGLILVGFRKWTKGAQYRAKTRIDGKVALVTGCNNGIGKALARYLVSRGAKVFMACRDLSKAEMAKKDIIKVT